MNLLAIDTSSKISVLGLKTTSQVDLLVNPAAGSHSRDILPRITHLLERNNLLLSDLDGIVFGQGPGSFTGLRIGVGVVQGLGFGLGIPVVPVSTLATMALRQHWNTKTRAVLVALSARKEEVYFGAYRVEGTEPSLVVPEGVCDVTALPVLPEDAWSLVGDGSFLEEKIANATTQTFVDVVSDVVPDGEALLFLGETKFSRSEVINAVEAEPEYLRETVAKKANE